MEKNKLENKENEFLKKMNEKIPKENHLMYSPAQLAYAGDAVYELMVRSYIIHSRDVNVNKMHKLSVKFVKANAQAYLINKLDSELSEEEKRIVKRGRNAKVTSSPKNAELMEYRYATGFEALLGYLYLSNNIDRLIFLFNKIIEIIDEKDEKHEDN
ncbi:MULTISPECIES: Mini-ribonuclease 3 [unclassified Sedimentibacter]|uniref:Mini-ribonuclease 3 n=1 Tax=unclassified Sedimentibacter TaxID=2649220 RepID=UPI0035A707FF